MEFSCSVCNYTSTVKQTLIRHINKKNKCSENPKIVEVPVIIQCEYCEKSYKTKPSLKRHLKTCKVKKEQHEKEVGELKQEVAVLRAELKATKEAKTSTTINNNTINIQINSLKDTDFSRLNDKHFQHALNRVLMSVPKLIELTHFNQKIPENHNIYISNQKGKYAMVFNGHEWELKNGQETIEQLINSHEYELEQWAEDKQLTDKYEKYLMVKDKEGAEDTMKEEVRLLLYNKRNMIKK